MVIINVFTVVDLRDCSTPGPVVAYPVLEDALVEYVFRERHKLVVRRTFKNNGTTQLFNLLEY